MKSQLRLGIAVAVNLLVFVLLVVAGIMMRSNGPSTATERFFPNVVQPQAEARIITRIISPAIESALQLNGNRRLALVTGPIACDEGEQVRIRVVIEQQSTGATGEGHTQTFCTGDIQTWSVKVVARGPVTFEAGPAFARASASTRRHGKVTDTFQ